MGVFDLADGTCERLGPGLLAEPLNIATGFVFLGIAWGLLRHPDQPGLTRLMCWLCAAAGATTVLLHLHPSRATEALDILPIIALVGVVFYGYARDVMQLTVGEAVSGVAVLLPFVAGSLLLLLLLEEPLASAGYASLPVFILGMAVVLRQREGDTGFRVMLAGLVLAGGLVLRGLDLPLCSWVPLGTHMLWHVAAAASIGMVIHTYRRHLLAAQGRGR
jgi:hypothetical protein